MCLRSQGNTNSSYQTGPVSLLFEASVSSFIAAMPIWLHLVLFCAVLLYFTSTISRLMDARFSAPHMAMVSLSSAPIFSM